MKNFKGNLVLRHMKGFTLIELLVVVAIIGILAAVIMTNTTKARNSGTDATVKANLRDAVSQGEIFFSTNTIAPNSYTNVCTNGAVGGTQGIGAMILSAAKASKLSSYGKNTTGTLTMATCNDSANAWAAEIPLSTAGQMWCADNTGKMKQETTSIGTNTYCP